MKLFFYRVLTFLLKPFVRFALYLRRKKGLETKDKKRMVERFGKTFAHRPKNAKVVWFNAASVGESNSIMPVVDRVLAGYPNAFVVVTTSSLTAADNMAKKLKGKNAVHQFLPVDRRAYVDRFFNYWKPELGFFVDSDFWPNLILSAKAHDVPLVLLNGRISDKSFAKWKKNLSFAKTLMHGFKFGFGKSDEDKRRLSVMGMEPVECVGNLKYGVPPMSCDKAELESLQKKIGKRPVFVVSSTHPGEEEICLSALLIIKKTFSNVLMILAPRHPARGQEIYDMVEANGLHAALRSRGDDITPVVDVYVADTMGELGLFYTLSDIAFVGGSLVPWGGHNPMEPARLHNVVLSGKNVMNFQETFDLLKAENAVIMLNNEKDFASKVKSFFENEDVAKEYMARAFCVAEREAAVLDRVMDRIKPELDERIGK